MVLFHYLRDLFRHKSAFIIGLFLASAIVGATSFFDEIRFSDTGSNYVGITAPSTVGSSYTLTLPDAAGTNGQFLQTDASGNLSFADALTGVAWGDITGTLSNQTDLQSALDAKQATGNYITALTGDVTATGPGSVVASIGAGVIVDADINATAAIDATKIADGSVTSTEFQYLGGATSDIQAQLDAITFDALSPMTTQGDVIYGGASGTGTRLGIGTAGQVLTVNAGATAPEWADPTGGGGSSGFISGENNNFDAGIGDWGTYDDAAEVPVNLNGGSPTIVTVSHYTADPLYGDGSLLISKASGDAQGEGVELDLGVIDDEPPTKPIKVKFHYSPDISGNLTFGSPTSPTDSDIYVYAWFGLTPGIVAMTPSYLDGSGYYEGTVQVPSNASSLRFGIHVRTTDTASWSLRVDSFQVDYAFNQTVNAISDGVSYTPSSSGFGGLGTVSTSNLKYSQVGDHVHITGTFVTGTVAASEARLPLPTGLTTKSDLPTLSDAGSWIRGASSTGHGGRILAEASKAYVTFTGANVYSSATLVPLAKANGDAVSGNTETLAVDIRVPIQGWTSGYTHPAQIGLNAKVLFVGTQTSEALTAGTTNATFTTVKDTTGSWSTNIYTVRSPGDYQIVLNSRTSVPSDLTVYKNGSSYQVMSASAQNTYPEASSIVMHDLIYGDTLSIRVGTSSTMTSSRLMIYKLGSQSQPYAPKTVVIRHTAASGTNGGTSTASAFTKITVNDQVGDTSFSSLSSGVITLQPGTYEGCLKGIGLHSNRVQSRLRNTSDSTTAILGSSEISGSGDDTSTSSEGCGKFSISSAKTFELQTYVQTAYATYGYGVASSSGETEVYSWVRLTKIL